MCKDSYMINCKAPFHPSQWTGKSEKPITKHVKNYSLFWNIYCLLFKKFKMMKDKTIQVLSSDWNSYKDWLQLISKNCNTKIKI